MVRGLFHAVVQLLIGLIRLLDFLHLGLTVAIGYHYLVGFRDLDTLQAIPGCVS